MTVYENYNVIAFKSCIQKFTVYVYYFILQKKSNSRYNRNSSAVIKMNSTIHFFEIIQYLHCKFMEKLPMSTYNRMSVYDRKLRIVRYVYCKFMEKFPMSTYNRMCSYNMKLRVGNRRIDYELSMLS